MSADNVVRLFSAAKQQHEGERMLDRRERLALAAAIFGVMLFGAICFDLGFRIASFLCR